MTNKINAALVEAANKKGFVVRDVKSGNENKFGKADVITIQNGQYTIIYSSNVLHGVNYFQILSVTDYLKNRHYQAWRFFFKFIPTVNEINGETYLALKDAEK